MFNKIAIIGTGLIGSSLALACKDKSIAKHIIGCSKTQKTIDTALGLGIIDEGTTNPAEAVKHADIVILCTPLNTYNSIAGTISRSLGDDTILTDAGSAKHIPTEHVLSALSHEQGFRFVPGHPIAGTEKSGPEAGFKELFEGRKTILTPLPITSMDALEKVKAMWEAVGSEVDIMDARRHDFIYASISHSIQLLSSCFGLCIDSQSNDIQKSIAENADVNFKKFIRLVASDPIMWRDIFLGNIHNLESTINVFFQNMTSLKESISSNETGIIAERLQGASQKRLYFHDLLKGEERREFRISDYSRIGVPEKVWMDIMPRLISCVIMEGISETEYEYATGAGLHGFTKNIILDGATETEDIFMNGQDVMEALKIFTKKVKEMLDLVLSEDSKNLQQKLEQSRGIYSKIVG